MNQTATDLIAPLAIFVLLYAALTGWRFAMRVRTERAGRKKGLALNALRRAGPPALAGLLVLGAGAAMALPGSGWLGGLLIGAGLAYALHRGLSEMRQDTAMLIALRVGASLGLTLAYLWVSGAA